MRYGRWTLLILFVFAMGLAGGFVFPAALAAGFFMAFPIVAFVFAVLGLWIAKRFFEYLEDVDQREGESVIKRSPIENIYVLRKLSTIKSQLPGDSTYYENFHKVDGLWKFTFHSHSREKDFEAVGLGATPRGALGDAERNLSEQIKKWNTGRYRSALEVDWRLKPQQAPN